MVCTILAESVVFVTTVVIGPDAVAAVLTYAGLRFVAVLTQLLAIEHKAVYGWMFLSTAGANKGFVHVCFLLVSICFMMLCCDCFHCIFFKMQKRKLPGFPGASSSIDIVYIYDLFENGCLEIRT